MENIPHPCKVSLFLGSQILMNPGVQEEGLNFRLYPPIWIQSFGKMLSTPDLF